MKYVIGGCVITVLLWIIIVSNKGEINAINIKLDSKTQTIDSLNNIIRFKDSLYKAHIKNCAFISKDQLDTNKYGDVYIKGNFKLLTNYYDN